MKIKQLKNGKWVICKWSFLWLGVVSPARNLLGEARFWWRAGSEHYRDCWLDTKEEAEKLLLEVESELGN